MKFRLFMLFRPYRTMRKHDEPFARLLCWLLLPALCFVVFPAHGRMTVDITLAAEPGAQFVTVKEVISSDSPGPLQYDLSQWLPEPARHLKVLWPADLEQENQLPLRSDDGRLELLYRLPASRVLSRLKPATWSIHQPLDGRLGYSGPETLEQIQLTLIVPAAARVLDYRSTSPRTRWQVLGNTLNLTATNVSNLNFNVEFTFAEGSNPEPSSATSSNQPCDSPEPDTLQAVICGMQPRITLTQLQFPSNSASLSPAARAILDKLVPILKQASVPIEIAAYTDSRGPANWNRQLSEERAYTIRLYLIYRGVAAEKLIAKGYGEENPVADNNTEAGRLANRRVVLRLAE